MLANNFETGHNTKSTPLAWLLLQIASIWLVSDIGYYTFLPVLGFGGGYTSSPVAITVYYLFWLLITLFAFWNIYKESKIVAIDKVGTHFLLLFGGISVVSYLAYVMPQLPVIAWYQSTKPPSELLIATPWYFLPKSIDILVQQLLVLAMALTFSFQKFGARAISTWCAILFGGAHLFLIFGGESLLYVIVFTVSAFLAGFCFPYLMLRFKNGFIYSYFLHWYFYAIVIVLARLIFKF